MWYSVYVTYLFMTAVIAVGGACYTWKRRATPGGTSLTAFLIAAATWALLDGLSAISGSADTARLLDSKVRFASVAMGSVAMLLVALEYTGQQQWFRRRNLLLLFSIPIITQLVIWFGPPDAFIAESIYVKTHGLYLPESRTFGPWFYVHAGYSYTLILAGLIILLNKAFHSLPPYRGQTLLLFAGLAVLVAVSLVRTFGGDALLRIDWIAIGFFGPVVFWPYALFQYGLLNLAPIAQNKIVEQMDDLVIGLDANRRVIYFNPAAQANFNWEPSNVIGQPVEAVLTDWQEKLYKQVANTTDIQTEIQVGQRVFDLRISPLSRRPGQMAGTLFVLRDITARKKVDDALAASEAKLASLLIALPDLVFHFNRAGEYLDVWGDQYSRLRSADRPRESIIGKTVYDLLPAPEAQLIHEHITRALDTAEVQTIEYRLPTTSGLTDFEARLVPTASDEVISVARDITHRKRTEEALRQSETHARTFQEKLVALHRVTVELAQIDDLPTLCRQAIELGRDRLGFERIGLFMIDEDDPTMMVGAFGLDPQGHLRDERATRDPIADNDLIKAALASKERFAVWEDVPLWDEHQIVGHGWNAMAVLWNGAESIGWLVADNLITQAPLDPSVPELLSLFGTTLGYLATNLRGQIALQESEARFRLLSEATFEGIVIHDQGIILDANHAFADMLGYPLDEIIGTHVLNMAPPDVRQIISDRIVSEDEEIYETTGRRKDGTTFPIDIRSRTMPYQRRMVRVATVRDLTQRKQVEQHTVELAMQKERVEMLANFITKATHEFRTPLSVIEARTYLLRKVTAPDKQQTYLSSITEQVRNLSALVDALVTMSRLDSGIELNLIPLDINEVLSYLLANLSAQFDDNNLTTSLELQDPLPPVRGDRNSLSQAFSNIVDNALRYTPAGGTITVRTCADTDHVVVEIRDTGIGMTAEQQQHIFDRFYRADEAHSTRGFGLGLSIVKRIVELHDGQIEVESAPGSGSAFRIVLPVTT